MIKGGDGIKALMEFKKCKKLVVQYDFEKN